MNIGDGLIGKFRDLFFVKKRYRELKIRYRVVSTAHDKAVAAMASARVKLDLALQELELMEMSYNALREEISQLRSFISSKGMEPAI